MNYYDKLLQYSFRLLAKKRYTSRELDKKLQQYLEKREIEDQDIVSKVLDRLFQLKYLDDEQFAKDYVNDRLSFKPRGEYMIKRELKLKGLSLALIEKVLNEIQIDEVEVAIKLLNKKERMWQNCTQKERKEKAFRFLSSKGLPIDAIYKAVDWCYNASSEVES